MAKPSERTHQAIHSQNLREDPSGHPWQNPQRGPIRPSMAKPSERTHQAIHSKHLREDPSGHPWQNPRRGPIRPSTANTSERTSSIDTSSPRNVDDVQTYPFPGFVWCFFNIYATEELLCFEFEFGWNHVDLHFANKEKR